MPLQIEKKGNALRKGSERPQKAAEETERAKSDHSLRGWQKAGLRGFSEPHCVVCPISFMNKHLCSQKA
jgi:hypothetical protein